MIFIIAIGLYSMSNTTFKMTSNIDQGNFLGDDGDEKVRYILSFGINFSPLAGAYCCGFFMH
jgi:hypothetical protein